MKTSSNGFSPLALALFLFFAVSLEGCKPASSESALKACLVVGSQGLTGGKFSHPRAIAVSMANGRFYVADRSGRIQLFEGDGRFLLQWSLPEFAQGCPVGLAVELDGNLLVNDSHYHRILRYLPDGSAILKQWGSLGNGPGQFTFGRDVVVDSAGFIYAGDYGGENDRIFKFSKDGALLLEWGGSGEEPGKLNRPQGMAIERRGGEELLLVADLNNHRVDRFTREGKWVNSIGKLGRELGELRSPISVAVGSDGTIYVCEWQNNRVQFFDPDGHALGSWGRAGHGDGELAEPWDVAVGPGDRVYVADYGNHRVQAFDGKAAAKRRI